MKRIAIAAAVLVVSVLAYGTWASTKKYTLRADIEIDAPADEVWAVLIDRDTYPRWNPFIVSSTGELREGSTVTNVLVGAGGGESTFTPTLVTVDPDCELRWEGTVGVPGIFDGEHWFRLVDLGDGKVRFEHGETFTGIAAPLLIAWVRSDTFSQFEAMNEALATEIASRR